MVAEPFTLLYKSSTYEHILSHQKLKARFYVVKSHSLPKGFGEKIRLARLSDLALPRLIEKFLSDCDLKEIL
jgi:hypothetical protein